MTLPTMTLPTMTLPTMTLPTRGAPAPGASAGPWIMEPASCESPGSTLGIFPGALGFNPRSGAQVRLLDAGVGGQGGGVATSGEHARLQDIGTVGDPQGLVGQLFD